jgi:tRNA dimethylallyltransferase
MIDLKTVSPQQTVLIAGPTASGKSALALAIAEAQGGLIVNADALQVHECWQILSARPDAKDLAQAPHALYGHIARDQTYSVGDWLREVEALKNLDERLIIVGGTGLYLSALTEGLSLIPSIPADVRHQGDALRRADFQRMQDELAARDPVLAARIDMANPMRVQRGWEVMTATGTPLSVWQANTPPALVPRDTAAALVLDAPKDWLTPRIEARFDAMMAHGALDEVRALAPVWHDGAPWTRAIGAPELLAHVRGNLSLDEAVSRAKIATRQFAKRQRTWFRSRMRDWLPVDSASL